MYDPASKKVFTFNGRSKDATAFDAASGEVAKTIPLGGKPESAQADGKGKIYVNIEDTSEVVEIDSGNLEVTRRFSLKPGEEPSGMGFDAEHHRVFSGCSNKMMTILDTDSGKLDIHRGHRPGSGRKRFRSGHRVGVQLQRRWDFDCGAGNVAGQVRGGRERRHRAQGHAPWPSISRRTIFICPPRNSPNSGRLKTTPDSRLRTAL